MPTERQIDAAAEAGHNAVHALRMAQGDTTFRAWQDASDARRHGAIVRLKQAIDAVVRLEDDHDDLESELFYAVAGEVLDAFERIDDAAAAEPAAEPLPWEDVTVPEVPQAKAAASAPPPPPNDDAVVGDETLASDTEPPPAPEDDPDRLAGGQADPEE